MIATKRSTASQADRSECKWHKDAAGTYRRRVAHGRLAGAVQRLRVTPTKTYVAGFSRPATIIDSGGFAPRCLLFRPAKPCAKGQSGEAIRARPMSWFHTQFWGSLCPPCRSAGAVRGTPPTAPSTGVAGQRQARPSRDSAAGGAPAWPCTRREMVVANLPTQLGTGSACHSGEKHHSIDPPRRLGA